MQFNTIQTKTGIINKAVSYGNAYDVERDTVAVAERAVRTGKRGRPAKAPEPVYYKTNDLFGRVPDTAPAGEQGRVIIGKASANAVYENDE